MAERSQKNKNIQKLRKGHQIIGSLSKHFACQDSSVSQIFKLIISNGVKILSNVKVVETRQVKRENSSLLVAVRGSKTLRA